LNDVLKKPSDISNITLTRSLFAVPFINLQEVPVIFVMSVFSSVRPSFRKLPLYSTQSTSSCYSEVFVSKYQNPPNTVLHQLWLCYCVVVIFSVWQPGAPLSQGKWNATPQRKTFGNGAPDRVAVQRRPCFKQWRRELAGNQLQVSQLRSGG